MKPFKDEGRLRETNYVQSSNVSFVPDKNGYGVEIRRGRDIFRRSNQIFISSGRWTDMRDDGIIDQEISPIVIGQLTNVLDFEPYQDQNERSNPVHVLSAGEIIVRKTIDFEEDTSKDGRITVFNIRARGYIAKEELPFQTRGIKVTNDSIPGYSEGIRYNPFLDGGESELGIPRVGFYGRDPVVRMVFNDAVEMNDLGIQIDTGDYDSDYETGAFGMTLYSAEFGTDSIAFAGLKK